MKAPPGKGAGPTLAGVEPGKATKHDDEAEGITNVGTIQTGEHVEQFDAEAHAVSAACTHALAYARIGWHVFPCHPGDKKPLIPKEEGGRGFHDATTDPEQIRAWWRRWPDAEIGMACGASGLVVVDLDVADGKNGIEALSAHLGADPHGATFEARTPRGGRHLFYANPDRRFGCAQHAGSMPGVDVRGVGGYVVLPAGRTGRTWLGDDPRDGCQLTEPRDRIVEFLPVAGIGLARKGRGSMAPAGTASEQRFEETSSAVASLDPSMLRLGGWLQTIFAVHAALDADERGADLVEEWSSRTSKAGQYREGEATGTYSCAVLPWKVKVGVPMVNAETLWAMARATGWNWPPQRTIEDVLAPCAVPAEPAVEGGQVESAEDIEQRDALNEPAQDTSSAEAFPLELVGGDDLVSAIVQYTVATSQSPQPALALANAIAFLGAVLGRRVAGSTNLRTNFLTVGVAPTAAGKEHSQHVAGDLAMESGMHALIKGAWKSGSALVTSLYQQPSQLVHLDEFGKFLQLQAGKHVPPHIAEIRSVLLQVFSRANGTFFGDCYADPRENAQKIIVEPNLCYFGATTPETFFAALQSGAIRDGFLNRHLVFFADGRPPRRRPERQEVARLRLVARLKELEHATKPAGNLAGGGIGGLPTIGSGCRTIEFDAAGYDAWDAIADAARLKHNDLDKKQDRSADLWGRYAEHVAKLALLRSVACDSYAKFVGRSHVEWADAVAGWCHRRMHREVERHLADTEVEQRTRRVLRIIEDAGRGGLSQTVLVRKTQWLTPRERKECLENLVDAKHVVSTTHPARRADGKGKPATIIRATSWDRRPA